MVAALLSDSGLQYAEREWKLGFYRGRGKDNALQVVAPYGAQPTPAGMLFLYGDYGVGKSGMMKAMVAGFCRDGHKARYVRAADIVLEAQASFDSRGGAERVRHKYERYQVLAVDEIDRVSFNEWTQSFLFGLLDARYNMRAGRATMVASNKALEQVPEYGYLASRMEDGLRVRVAGDKLRGGGNG